jgi:hypothetical protein
MTTGTKKDLDELKIQYCHQHKKRLPPDQIEITVENGWVIASLYEYPKGCRWWDRFSPSDLPNNLISRDDLIRFGIDLSNLEPINC